MSDPGPARLLRLLTLVLAALAATELVRRLVTPPLGALAHGLATEGPVWDRLSFETVLAGCCGVALSLAWAWLLLGGAVVAADALRRGGTAHPGVTTVPGCPLWVHTLVLAVLGIAVSAGPALADTQGPAPASAPGPSSGLVGLALPDRVLSPSSATRRHVEVVRPGDTLWKIAARRLPPAAGNRTVNQAWHRLAAANLDRVDDPDLIFPGTVLRVPDLAPPARKEAP